MTETSAVYRIKFHDGPYAGQTLDLTAPTRYVKMFAGVVYESTERRDGDYWVFVRIPRGRVERKLIKYILAQTGHDPRMQEKMVPTRKTPRGRNQMCYCGSGKKYKVCHGR